MYENSCFVDTRLAGCDPAFSIQLFNIASTVLRVFSAVAPVVTMSNPEKYQDAKSIYEFSAKDIQGNVISLEKYKDHVCIVVNVASQCGYTKNNYAELVDLYNEYAETKGLRILAFPCNQFANEEPGSNEEICQFVASKNVKFDVFGKVSVNGNDAHPLWKYLKHKKGGTLGDFIKWNFTKFIIDKNGQPVERYGPSTNPKDLVKSLEKYW
jgi:phospholipid-hydroperoxide glutathione peroxidase